MKYKYKEACAEVCFILENLEENGREKIPTKLINLLEKNKSKAYKVAIDLSIPLEYQQLKKETKAILTLIYRKFLCSNEEKKLLEEKFQKELEEIKKEDFNVKNKQVNIVSDNNILIKDKEKDSIADVNNEIALTTKNNILKKFLLKIKNFSNKLMKKECIK